MTTLAFDQFTVTSGARNRWSLALSAGPDLEIIARLLDGWLLCDAPAPGSLTPEPMLAHNAVFPAFVKLATDSVGAARWRAEILLEEDSDAESALRNLAPLFAAAVWQVEGHEPVASPDAPPVALETMPEICAGAGWPAASRQGQCRVELSCAFPFHAALLPCGAGIRAVVEIGRLGDASETCALAAATLLAAAGGFVRMVRPAIAEGVATLEILFPGKPSAALLDAAFSALSVAADRCAREAAALIGNETLASAYLASRAQPSGLRLQSKPTTGENK